MTLTVKDNDDATTLLHILSWPLGQINQKTRVKYLSIYVILLERFNHESIELMLVCGSIMFI